MEKKLMHCWIFPYALLVITITTTIEVPLSSCLAQTPKSLSTDQTALLSLKSHITSDPSRTLATNWTQSSPVCSWHGITCSSRHSRVAALDLSNLNLSGTVPPQLGQLSFLVSLDLTSNNFSGALPHDLCLLRRLKSISLRFNNFTGDMELFSHFPKLQHLNLRNNSFSGPIPKSFSNLTNLQSINVSYNSLIGEIPPEFGRIQSLRDVRMAYNRLSGALPPAIFNKSNLETLSFTGNELSGVLPAETCANLPFLTGLYLSENQLSGPIPTNLSRCSRLEDLSLSYNFFSGAIPPAIFNMSNLETLSFTGNELSGVLPAETCANLPFLTVLHLSVNQLSGPIPTNLSRCSRLEDLSLSYNFFSGAIPAEIGYLTSLQALGLGGNKLSGRLPHEIGNLQRLFVFAVENNEIEGPVDFDIFMNMSSLETLLLWRNRFTGNILRDVGNLTTLMSLELTENSFSGAIPREIGQLYQLEMLTLAANEFSDSIPHELFNISTIRILAVDANALTGTLPTSLCHSTPFHEKLYLADNSISGAIPNSISNCSQLRLLSASQNKFTGLIPPDLGNLRLLEVLELSENNLTNAHSSSSSEPDFITSLTNCKFLTRLVIGVNPLHGTLPASIGNLSSQLQIFDATASKLSGNIPDEIGNLSSLMVLDLMKNDLSGNVPLSIKHLGELQGLYLSDNMLGGSIPEALCDLHTLSVIVISRNQFSGPIPGCLGNISSLRSVFLGSNMLNSSIPSSLWGLEDLSMLELSSNSLSGHISEEIGNLRGAIYINLSMNQFSGSIPSTLGKLHNLVNMSLANNRLEGSIPESIGSLISLVTLDLSYNNLSGSIPKSLEALRQLNFFNVSFNTLSGEIPNGGSFKNFTIDSFKGNEALCGVSRLHIQSCLTVSHYRSKRKKVRSTLFIILGVVAFVVVVFLAFIFVRYRKKDKTTRNVVELLSIEPERISYYELVQGTEHFNESNSPGTGSSCSVYKCVLSGGKVIAVKVFNMELQGTSRRFEVECEMLRNVRHRNLTSVISSCSNEDFKALVLEYMPKGNLEQWLYSHNYCLNVLERLNIMIDVASALEYLHHGYSTPIVHSDMKPSNVLLDEDMVAHVSDFGISKLLSNGDSFVLTNTFATLGYIAPEYGLEGLVSTRCDVYSYGVTLMETFTRKRPSDDIFVEDLNLKSWVKNSLAEMPDEVIDANLVMGLAEEQFNKNMQCASSILELALKCSANSPADRINMKEAHVELQKIKRWFLQ